MYSNNLPPRALMRVTDECYRVLHNRIISGELPPGSRIAVEAISEELGVSRTPVREAVLKLESAGLVERQPYRGTVVTGVDENRLDEVTAIRLMLEGLVTEIGTLRLTTEEIDRMEEIQDEIERMGAQPEFSLGVFNDLNKQFHDILFHAADTPVLTRLLDIVGAEADRIRLHFPLRSDTAHRHHREIIAACRARDAGAAKHAAQDHLLDAYRGMRGSDATLTGPFADVLSKYMSELSKDDQ